MKTSAFALPDWEDPREILQRFGRRASRSYSQNFLVNRGAAETIAQAAAPHAGVTVIELGAGLGHLTWALLRQDASVVAIDLDRDMLEILKQRFLGCPTLRVVEGDATQVVLRELAPAVPPAQLAVAGNIPYAVTGAIVRNLTEQATDFSHAVLMVQREVSQRLRAAPGGRDYGLLSVFAQARFKIERVLSLSEGSFYPAPKVRSEVVLFTPLATPRADCGEDFSTVVRHAFQQRRKTILNTLSRVCGSKELAAQIAKAAQIDPGLRPEMLSIEDFARLTQAWRAVQPA